MATINLGAIKFKWQGAYNAGTAYTVDDVVSYNGSSYICILASTGNLPTNATYWEQMSSAGTNGTDGTDLTTTLTTQGDIVYRDASGLARLGAGTSGQVLQTNGTGANPSWGTVSSDFVKLASGSVTSGSSLSIDGYFSSTYPNYKLIISDTTTWWKMRFNFGGSAYTGGNYVWAMNFATRTSSSDTHSSSGGWNVDYIPLSFWNGDNTAEHHHAEATFIRPWDTSNRAKTVHVNGWDYNSSELHIHQHAGYLDNANYGNASTGITAFPASGNFSDGNWELYGIK